MSSMEYNEQKVPVRVDGDIKGWNIYSKVNGGYKFKYHIPNVPVLKDGEVIKEIQIKTSVADLFDYYDMFGNPEVYRILDVSLSFIESALCRKP